ncbi:recombination mediator RecR [Allofustis seminis]|uniref:recombination mediator RecR n=1 Tax=Allofustis seminis TaxID=166939 RepID=UPI000365B19A|nr:recombination mediator RecR [Allofustis seminis]
MYYPEPLSKLMDSFMKLPGIGEKTAARLAFYVVSMREEDVTHFARHLISAKRDLNYCKICGNLTAQEICSVCSDTSRDRSLILVVEHPKDVIAMEKIQEYHGFYHVLGGVLSPVEGTGPEDINVPSLLKRLQNEEVTEVILAMNANVEGEATATYLSRLIKPAGIKVTRLAHGLSVGSDIEYANEVTLMKAIEGRTEI